MLAHFKKMIVFTLCVMLITSCAPSAIESYQDKVKDLKLTEVLDTQQEVVDIITEDFEDLADSIKKSITGNTDINEFIDQVDTMEFDTLKNNAIEANSKLTELEKQVKNLDIKNDQVKDLNEKLLQSIQLYHSSLSSMVQMVTVSEEGMILLRDLFQCYLELSTIAIDEQQLSEEYEKAANDVLTENESLFTELSRVDYTLILDSDNFNVERLESINKEIDNLINGYKAITTFTEDDEAYNVLKIQQYELIRDYIKFSITNQEEMTQLFNPTDFSDEMHQANELLEEWKNQAVDG